MGVLVAEDKVGVISPSSLHMGFLSIGGTFAVSDDNAVDVGLGADRDDEFGRLDLSAVDMRVRILCQGRNEILVDGAGWFGTGDGGRSSAVFRCLVFRR